MSTAETLFQDWYGFKDRDDGSTEWERRHSAGRSDEFSKSAQAVLVLNWFEELQARVPTGQ